MPPLPASDPQSDVFTSFSLAHSTNLRDQLPNTSSPWLSISTRQSSSSIERGESMKRVEKDFTLNSRTSSEEKDQVLKSSDSTSLNSQPQTSLNPSSSSPPRPSFASHSPSSHSLFTPDHTPPLKRYSDSSSFPHRLFDPAVGGAMQTPTRSRIYTLQKNQDEDVNRGTASLPITPQKLDFASSLGRNDSSSNTSHVNATWPPRSFRISGMDTEKKEERVVEEQLTPTKKGKGGSRAELLVPDEEVSISLTTKERIATRYVMVEGVDKHSSEKDLRYTLIIPLKSLSLRGCYTSRLSSEGIVVLVFHDVRDSLSAIDYLDSPNSGLAHTRLEASCITRKEFEQLHDHSSSNPLLSLSEGVLVFTVSSTFSNSIPHFAPLPLLSSYGDIRSVQVIEEKLHIFEYFDDRSAERAKAELDKSERGGLRYHCSFEPSVSSTEMPSSLPSFASKNPSTSPSYPFTPARYAPDTPSFSPFSPLLTPAPTPTAINSSTALQAAFSPFATSPLSPPLSPNPYTYSQQYQQDSMKAPWTQVRTGETSNDRLFGAKSRFDQGAFQPSYPFSPPLSPSTPSSAQFHLPSLPSISPSFPVNPVRQAERTTHRQNNLRLPPSFGIVRDDQIPVSNVINYERIEQGLEVRTTLMLKNVPNKLKDFEVMQFIEEVVGRSFDFFYLRTDYATGCNVGYGFVNFTSLAALLSFCKQRLGTRWNMCNSDKLCVLSFANIQGKASLINHFRNSSVLDQDESRRPKLFVTSGTDAGQPERFPMCDDPVRKMRSALNAANVGLFPSQKPVFKIAQAIQGMDI
ncbi:hypothetical protein JCM5353_000438 [Sporobolomyces roseus]